MSVVVTLVVALACGCADAGPAGPAGAAQSIHIDTNTPQGLRAKQIMDMLNSDWPIGPNGIRTLAAPKIMDDVGVTMDKIWWDRPFTADRRRDRRRARHASRADLLQVAPDHRAAHQRRRPGRPVRCVAGAAGDQVVEGHRRRDLPRRARVFVSGVEGQTTASATWWRAPTPTCRFRWRRSSNSMCCLRFRTPSRRAPSSWDDQLTVTEEGKARRRGRSRRSAARHHGVGADRRAADDLRQRQHGHRPADRSGWAPVPSSVHW